MNLNLHLVHVSATFDKPQGLEAQAKAALFCEEPSHKEMLSMAELLDWEHGSQRHRSMLGLRCELALLQLLDEPQSREILMGLADQSPCVADLCALRAVRAARTQPCQIVRLAA